jgi:hypothetical protein
MLSWRLLRADDVQRGAGSCGGGGRHAPWEAGGGRLLRDGAQPVGPADASVRLAASADDRESTGCGRDYDVYDESGRVSVSATPAVRGRVRSRGWWWGWGR